ncbi:paraquat-inducible protein A [Arcobacter vandammei]|uniref:paraquat-inducible protein A n=1 Tax=Arcobacter vandammei TaxID=2782243 RepID=UPI001D195466|nr:paraquat-inducible protein A [Arcobacter vandammei]
MIDLNKVVECYSCGLFVEKSEDETISQICPRCESKLAKKHNFSIDSLFYAISSLMLFFILSLYPIISLNINGQELDANILKTVYILYEQDFYIVSFLVLFTIILAPVLNSIVVILVFFQTKFKVQIFKKPFLYDSYHFFKEWGFIEVFVISLIVTYIKLVGMVSDTKFDIGFFVILAYVFCFIMSNIKFDASAILDD